MARPRRARIETITERASVTPLELFFDLVFALTRVTDRMADEPIIPGQRALPHSHAGQPPRSIHGSRLIADISVTPGWPSTRTWYDVALAGTYR